MGLHHLLLWTCIASFFTTTLTQSNYSLVDYYTEVITDGIRDAESFVWPTSAEMYEGNDTKLYGMYANCQYSTPFKYLLRGNTFNFEISQLNIQHIYDDFNICREF